MPSSWMLMGCRRVRLARPVQLLAIVLPSSRRYGTVALAKRAEGEVVVSETQAFHAPPKRFASAVVWQNVSIARAPPSLPLGTGTPALTKTRLHVPGAHTAPALASGGASLPASWFGMAPPDPPFEPPEPDPPPAPDLPAEPPTPAETLDPAAPLAPDAPAEPPAPPRTPPAPPS